MKKVTGMINAKRKMGKINKEIYGHFSEHLGRCIYEGIFVGEDSEIPNTNGMRNDVVEALKELEIPVLRWPGGCFADEYHWMDGIGEKENRKRMINTHWGGVVEDNSFGTHEFFELCDQLGCEPYINGNVGSGSVREMSEWIEYMTFDGESPMSKLRQKNGRKEPWKVKYFGVGNENWGCGGNMRPEYYGDLYRRYQTYVRNYNSDRPVAKIACGASADDYHWTDKVLETTFDHGWGFMNGMSLHYYTVPSGNWQKKGSATDFDEKEWYRTLKGTLKMEELIRRHGAIMDQYDPQKKIGMIVDEWGTWYDVEPGTNPGFLYQQNTMRDALVAGINLNLFNKNCDRVKMANIAQMVNVLQAVILTDGDRMVKTPTWHAFNLYKFHQDAELVESSVETVETGLEEGFMIPNLSESVSLGKDGRLHVTLTNASLTDAADIQAIFSETRVKSVKAAVLTGSMKAHNTFDTPDTVHAQEFTDLTVNGNQVSFTAPACSVMHLEVEI